MGRGSFSEPTNSLRSASTGRTEKSGTKREIPEALVRHGLLQRARFIRDVVIVWEHRPEPFEHRHALDDQLRTVAAAPEANLSCRAWYCLDDQRCELCSSTAGLMWS
jgi:hypothetical protein